MPLTFGSVGNIITLSILIKDLVKSLDESRGSSAEYRAAIRELHSLDRVLSEIGFLLESNRQSMRAIALTTIAVQCVEQCRRCISEYLNHVTKFQKNLSVGGSGSFLKDGAAKLQWQISEKEKLARFRAEINAQYLSLSVLLAGVAL